MKRMPYIIMTILFPITSAFLLEFSSNMPILNLVACGFFLIIMMIASAYRLENIGWMPTYAWLYLIPVINIPLIYYCCHLPMNYVVDGKIDLAGKIIRAFFRVIFFLLLAIIIASSVIEISI